MAAIANVASDINLKGHGIAQAVAHCSVGGQRDCLLQTFSKLFKFEILI